MAKMKNQEPQKPKDEAKKQDETSSQRDQMVTPSSLAPKGKVSGKGNRPQMGGTAVSGARSTQPKQLSTTNNPQQQQTENYNRDMRRRMDHLGTGPNQNSPADQRKKRLEKRKRRIDERRQEIKKVAATGPRNITLGRRNTYFLIGVAVLIIIIIVLAILVNNHVL